MYFWGHTIWHVYLRIPDHTLKITNLCMQQLVSPEVLLCDIISCHMIFLQNINKM